MCQNFKVCNRRPPAQFGRGAGTARRAKLGAEATQPLSPDVRLPPESESTPVQFPGRPLASCCCCCCCCCCRCCCCCCCYLFALRWRERTAGRSRPGTEKRNGRTAVADCKGPTAGRLATCRRRTTDAGLQTPTAGRPCRLQTADCRQTVCRRQAAEGGLQAATPKGRLQSSDGRLQGSDHRTACHLQTAEYRRPTAGRPCRLQTADCRQTVCRRLTAER